MLLEACNNTIDKSERIYQENLFTKILLLERARQRRIEQLGNLRERLTVVRTGNAHRSLSDIRNIYHHRATGGRFVLEQLPRE